MAINPPACALPTSMPIFAAAPPVTEPTTAVAPTGEAAQQGRTDTATSDPSRQENHPSPADAIEEINASLQTWATNLRFEIDPDIQRLVVSVVDSDSGNVLRTVPNEAVIRIAKMAASLQGNVVSTTA